MSEQKLLPLLYRAKPFDPGRTLLIQEGLAAHFAGDYVKAIHVLIPQIEHCLRRPLAGLGKATNKHRRSDLGIMVEKSLNDILEAEPVIQSILGPDVSFYLRGFLCDHGATTCGTT